MCQSQASFESGEISVDTPIEHPLGAHRQGRPFAWMGFSLKPKTPIFGRDAIPVIFDTGFPGDIALRFELLPLLLGNIVPFELSVGSLVTDRGKSIFSEGNRGRSFSFTAYAQVFPYDQLSFDSIQLEPYALERLKIDVFVTQDQVNSFSDSIARSGIIEVPARPLYIESDKEPILQKKGDVRPRLPLLGVAGLRKSDLEFWLFFKRFRIRRI